MKFPKILNRVKYQRLPTDYKISYIDECSYNLTISLPVKSHYAKLILEHSLKALKAKKHIHEDATVEPEKIEEFEISKDAKDLSKYMNTLSMAIKTEFRKVVADCKQIDKRIINIGYNEFRLNKVNYKLKKDEWKVTFHIEGEYKCLE